MPTNPVPSLSTQDFISDSSNKFAQLMADFFFCNHSQSYVFAGTLTSAAHIVQQAGTDTEKQIELMKSGLSDYLRRYYDNVTVDVQAEENTVGELAGQNTLIIKINVIDGGSPISYGQQIVTADGLITSIKNLINYGK